MNQTFSSIQLFKLCKKTEQIESELSKEELLNQLEITVQTINNDTFEFNLKQVNDYILTDKLSDRLILRKLNDNLRRLYKDQQSNRRIIISQIKTLLEETCTAWLLKTDIKKFYESINRPRLVEKLQTDPLLSYQSIKLLKKLFDNPLIAPQTGLLRGLAISATLSELYMRKFDKWIRQFPGVYYYARYVDDIIIFANSKNTILELKNQLNPQLKTLAEGLVVNDSKTREYDINNIPESNPLEYLGYKFTVNKIKKNEKSLVISIADKKVKKIKTRIILAFLNFLKSKDFELLKVRMKFLTGNYSIRKSTSGNDLKAGIYYNYLNVTNLKVFDALNLFYQKVIFSKRHSFGRRISSELTTDQKIILSKFSFKHGFTNKTYFSFLPSDVNKIKSCWK